MYFVHDGRFFFKGGIMKIFLLSAHQVLDFTCHKTYQRYIQQANQLEKVQRNKLKVFLGQHISQNLSYEQFTKKFPLTRYGDWKSKIEQAHSI